MVNSKEYGMLFKLSAQLGKEFGTTFSSAQKTLMETQKEIRSLNQQQADIGAYQKQQKAVEATSRKLSDLKQEYDNIQREIQETEGFSSSLENKLIEKQRAIDRTSDSLKNQTDKLYDMEKAMQNAGVDTGHLTEESEKLAKQIDDLSEKQAKASAEAKNYGTEGVSAFEAAGAALVAVGLQKGFSEFVGLCKDAADGARLYADEILTLSTQYGVAADKLQSYYYAAELVDVSTDTITSSMSKNVRSMYSAAEGTESYIEAYKKLGITVTDANGKLRDSEEVYWEVIDALGRVTNESERDGIAMELLGRNAMQLNTLIKAGSGTMQSYAEEAQKTGYILSGEMLATLGKLDDAEQRQQNNILALKNTIGGTFAEELTKLKEIENDVLAGITEFSAENPAVVKSIIAVTTEFGAFFVLYNSYKFLKNGMNALRSVSVILHAKENAEVTKEAVSTTAAATASSADAAAKTAEAAATTSATAAQTGLNAAMMANPIGLIVAGVAALTVGVIALAEIIKSETNETKKLTAVSREQYNQLKALENEYRQVCDTYGESSYQAQELSWQLQGLSNQYEENKRTLSEYREMVDSAQAAHDEMISSYLAEQQELENEGVGLLSLTERLETLTEQSDVSAECQQEILAITKALNSEVPGLSLSYDSLTGSLSSSVDAIREMIDAMMMAKKYDAYQDQITEAMKEVAVQEQIAEEARKNRIAAEREVEDLTEKYYASMKKWGPAAQWETHKLSIALADCNKQVKQFAADEDEANRSIEENQNLITKLKDEITGYAKEIYYTEEATRATENFQNALKAVRRGYLDVNTAAKYYGVSSDVLQNAIDDVENYRTNLESAIDAVTAGYYTVTEAAEIYGVTVNAIETTSTIQKTIDKIGELRDQYYEVRDASEKSIQGQYDLWDMAAVVIATDIDQINTSLETQLSYWSDYNTDLADLLKRTDDIDGLSEVIASFADGSAESVNAIAGMAAASDEELRKMVGNWQEVQKQQEEAANSIAELATGFSDELDNMKSDLEKAVESLNLDDEAAQAAKETVDAYVQAMRDGTGDAVKAASTLASLVASAFKNEENISAVQEYIDSNHMLESDRNRWGQDSTFRALLQEYINQGGSIDDLKGYATGTNSAAPGFSLVGENGPEIIYFKGGEKVLTARETQAYMRQLNEGTNYPRTEAIYDGGVQQITISISPSFVVELGNGDIEYRLRTFSDELKDEIFDALDEAGIDAKRGVYA